MMNPLKTFLACTLAVAVATVAFAKQQPANQPQTTEPPAPTVRSGPFAPAALAQEGFANSVRIKDITTIEGVRTNHITGFGLVTGLSGTGARAQQTQSAFQNLFLRQGLQVGRVETRNLSMVRVTGKIPPFTRAGERIFVNVSVFDDATSLRGGELGLTILEGIDGQAYAVAQGSIVGAGVAAAGGAAGVQKNHPTVGRCEAIVEREICCDYLNSRGSMNLLLHNKEYSTAVRVANSINRVFPGQARTLDGGTVEVFVPQFFRSRIPEFVSMIGRLTIVPDQVAKVVINQRTGTIVMGQNVKLARVLFSNESLIITTAESPEVSQPAPFSDGATTVVPRTSLDVYETGGNYNVIDQTITVAELGAALNRLGVSPNTLITVFTTLKEQGALQADLEIE